MKYFKKMVGTRCYLSPVSMDDAEKFTEWLNDTEVSQYLQIVSQNISLYSEKEFMPKLIKSHVYSIVDLNTDTLIGNCGLLGIDHLNRTAEIGIFIGNKDYWSRGYGEEAMKLLLGYAFNFLNLRNIMLQVYSFNERAVTCYKKIGFKEIGRRRKALLRNMDEHDIIYFDILNNECGF